MPVILPAAAFFSLFLLLAGLQEKDRPGSLNWREAFLKAIIIWYAYLSIVTEILGWARAITYWGIVGSWALGIAILAWPGFSRGLFRDGAHAVRGWAQDQNIRRDGWKYLIVVLFALVLAVIAFLSPPNTNDSLTYHMSRVMHWIQNQTLAHYPTNDLRQLWNPPGVEYVILHLQILAGSDRFAPFVQWTSFIGCLIAVSLVADLLGAGVKGRWLAVFFCLTIPMAIIQATSTQNDLTTAFWAMASIYWALLAIRKRYLRQGELVFFGLSAGLGVLSKGTFYVYVIPFFIWLFFILLRTAGLKKTLLIAIEGMLLVFLLNAGIWSRNLSAFGSPLGDPASVSELTNQQPTPGGVLSILTRNVGMEVLTPFDALNRPILDAIQWIHTQIHQDLNDPRTSLRHFSIQFTITSEDYGINPIHLWIILILWAASIYILLDQRIHKKGFPCIPIELLAYSGMTFGMLILFSAFYKWQPWGGRLLLPFFIAASPLFGLFVEKVKIPLAAAAVTGALIVIGLAPLFLNTARPILKAKGRTTSVLTTPRQDLLFVNSPELKVAYVELSRWVKVTHCERLGLIIVPGENEYPLWAILSPSGKEIRIEHLDPSNPLGEMATPRGVGTKNFHPCAVFVTNRKFDRGLLPGFQLAEYRDGAQLYVLPELMPYIR